MSTAVYAVLERRSDNGWELAHPPESDPQYPGERVPRNVAPGSWGKFNFTHYYELSGERDLPDPISKGLRSFLAAHWPVPNRPSWMTLTEIRQHEEEDAEGRYAHLNWRELGVCGQAPDDRLRVVFWADQ